MKLHELQPAKGSRKTKFVSVVVSVLAVEKLQVEDIKV